MATNGKCVSILYKALAMYVVCQLFRLLLCFSDIDLSLVDDTEFGEFYEHR